MRFNQMDLAVQFYLSLLSATVFKQMKWDEP